jgi:hypothetical protein
MHWKLSFTRGVSTLGVEAASGSVLKAEFILFYGWCMCVVYGAWGARNGEV